MQLKNIQKLVKTGLAFAKNGEPEKAVDCFRKAIEQEPDQPVWVYSNLGNQLLYQCLIPEATTFFEDLKYQRPDLHVGFTGLARIARVKKEWQKCIDLWEICFRQFPEQAQAFWYVHQADALLELNHTEKAEKNYNVCTKKYPDKVASFVGLAKLAQHTNQWQKALDYWQICFDRFPSEIQPKWHQHKQRVLLELGQTADAQREALSQLKSNSGKEYGKILLQKLENTTFHNLNFQHILIITYGRSGSTLLQGILNTIDGVVLRGENDNVFFDFFKTYQKLIELKDQYKNAVLPIHSWYGMSFFDEALLMDHYRELAKGILLADHYKEADKLCVGFKEIRYDEVGDQLEAYLDFLARLFPNAAFIFNTRNLEDVTKSAWWKEADRDTVLKELSALEAGFEAYAKDHEVCFQINYDDIITKGKKLQDLFRFLGASYHPEIIDVVLSTPHSYSPEQQHIKRLFN